MNRTRYLIRRLLLVIPTLIGISIICFALCQFVPGGPVEQTLIRMRGEGGGAGGKGMATRGITDAHRREIERHFGFDKPIPVRYWNWVSGVARLDFGTSYKYPNKSAWRLIKERFPVSLTFGLTGFLLQYLICVPLGIRKAVQHGSRFDIATSVIVFAGYAAPAFAFGMILKMAFCGTTEGLWNWFPLGGFVSDDYESLTLSGKARDIAHHMVLPVTCYVIGAFAVLTLLMKNSLLDQIQADYVRTALAKGCSLRRAIWAHAFRNALIPIATGFGGFLTLIFAGSVLIEQVFNIPGMGQLSLDAITSRDYNVFMGILIVQSFLSLVGNIVSDFAYVIIDPRITFEGR